MRQPAQRNSRADRRLGMVERQIATWTNATIAGILSLHACPARCGARRRCGTAKLRSAPCLPLRAGTLLRHSSPRQAAHAPQRLIAPDDTPSPIQQLRASPSLRGVSRHTFRAVRARKARVRTAGDRWNDPHAVDHIDAMQRRLDLEERALAFDLAMRLREAEFLARVKEWEPAWAQRKNIKTRDLRPRLLRAVALLAPCVVSTVYKAANYGCFFDGPSRSPTLPSDRPPDL